MQRGPYTRGLRPGIRLLPLSYVFTTAERPAESEAERPAGMDARIQPLAEFITEKGAKETECLASIVYLVAMSEEEPFA